MIRTRHPLARLTALAAVGAAALISFPAWADAEYQQDRSRCISDSSGQERSTCMKEAAAAQQERRRGGVDTYGSHNRNGLARCEQLPDADRADCVARMTGKSSTNRRTRISGSVAGGGLLRETTTTTVVPASAPTK